MVARVGEPVVIVGTARSNGPRAAVMILACLLAWPIFDAVLAAAEWALSVLQEPPALSVRLSFLLAPAAAELALLWMVTSRYVGAPQAATATAPGRIWLALLALTLLSLGALVGTVFLNAVVTLGLGQRGVEALSAWSADGVTVSLVALGAKWLVLAIAALHALARWQAATRRPRA